MTPGSTPNRTGTSPGRNRAAPLAHITWREA
jgi:hypothetical protein